MHLLLRSLLTSLLRLLPFVLACLLAFALACLLAFALDLNLSNRDGVAPSHGRVSLYDPQIVTTVNCSAGALKINLQSISAAVMTKRVSCETTRPFIVPDAYSVAKVKLVRVLLFMRLVAGEFAVRALSGGRKDRTGSTDCERSALQMNGVRAFFFWRRLEMKK